MCETVNQHSAGVCICIEGNSWNYNFGHSQMSLWHAANLIRACCDRFARNSRNLSPEDGLQQVGPFHEMIKDDQLNTEVPDNEDETDAGTKNGALITLCITPKQNLQYQALSGEPNTSSNRRVSSLQMPTRPFL